jgi:hypothetical protein
MGNYGSVDVESSARLRQKEKLAYLGNHYPFGDAELMRLYNCFFLLQKKEPTTFLSDWAVYAPHDDDNTDLAHNRAARLLFVEQDILPAGFGRRLEQTAFLRPGDPPRETAAPVPRSIVSEEVQQEQLERFFEGASNACGRRGTRSALTILFQCCARNEEGGYACESRSGINRHTCRAHAGEVLHLGYALALATAYLAPNEKEVSDDNEKDEDEDQQELEPVIESVNPQDFLPQFGDSNDTINNPKLHALSKSLVEFSKGRDGLTSPYQSSHDTSNKAGDINSDLVLLDVFLEWAESVAPLISATLSTFMHYILFPDVPHSPTRTSFFFPSLRNQASAFFNAPNSPLLFTFACMSNSLGGKWHRLYTSDSDGLSFNRLQNSLLGYGGPTLLIIRETLGGGVFGAFTAHAWKESKDFYGNSDCFLFQLLPACAVYRPSGNGRAYMYCNSEARSKGYDRLSHGIGFGGNTDQPRLFISECFDGCTASSQDLTFERGVLLPRGPDGNLRKRFDIESLEVWGVGGDDMVAGALGARDRQREIVAANIRKARKVDKAQFLDDFQSGLIESKAFQHRDQVRGRDSACIDDMDAKNYKNKK